MSVRDLGRALALYRDVLGLVVTAQFGEIARLDIPGSGTELLLHERPPTPGSAGVALSFRVDDVDSVTAAAEKAGAAVVDAPEDQPWGERQAVLTDADGHVICLIAV